MSAAERMGGGCSGWEYDPLFRMMGRETHWSASDPMGTETFIDLDEMGHDDLDDEVMLGSIRGNIVGIQYYSGTVGLLYLMDCCLCFIVYFVFITEHSP